MSLARIQGEPSSHDAAASYGCLAMDLFDQLGRSISEFGTRLRLVRAEHWGLATPCQEWDVRELVNHVVGGAVRYTMLLAGATADQVVATRTVITSEAIRRVPSSGGPKRWLTPSARLAR